MLRKRKIILVIFIVAIILMPIGSVKAVLQANPSSHYKQTNLLPGWIKNARSIEERGGAMGLSETINSDLTPSSESNNIDVHLLKATEYGGIVILSASGYGNPQKLQESAIKTTTGNKTGIYFSGSNWEFISGGLEGRQPYSADKRYYDSYTDSQSSARVGDALGNKDTSNPGCAGWHDASLARWVYDRFPYFMVASGGIFTFDSDECNSYYCYGRGVAICGAGF